MANRMPGCRDQPREWRAFACGGHVAGRIAAGLRRHQGSLGGLHSADQRLTTAHVDQWKCDAEALARFVGEQLGLRTHGDVTLVVADATAVALARTCSTSSAAPTSWTPPPFATSSMRRRPPTRATRRAPSANT